MSDQEKRKAAIDTIARHVVHASLEAAIDGYVSWEDYPELGFDDWNRVVKRANGIVDSLVPPSTVYEAAYEHLAAEATP